ncbi:ABC transporter substrate-binding protein [Uliginosibacterium sp. H1]|uniref:ABC transporter substrate-binding protein n=1 Tax=Uliginosibacterium sp. H1 TaxID=3114757 RepID=UPI002E18DB97|nr:ABC transporter substrate binding protein [Uliginosibacterium sp. H1]
MNRMIRWALSFLAIVATDQALAADAPAATSSRPLRVFHVMSFDSPWRWTDGQLEGFKKGLGSDVKVEYRVFQMDVKRNSTHEAKEKKGQEARAIIDEWKPDLVYTSDDDAQTYVTKHYANTKLPFVFSGMNKTPADHGLQGASNIAGVLEQEHFVETVKLLQAINPKVKRLAVIGDDAPHWAPVIERIRTRMAQLPGSTLVAVDIVKTFDEYKAKLQSYPQVADAVVQLGVFTIKDNNGAAVKYQDILRWTAENSKLPDVSFWIDRIHYGVLAAVTVSEREQGLAAGKLARSILVDKATPSSLPMKPTLKGTPSLSLARAKALNYSIKSSLLLSSEVVTAYEWEKQ